jgi:hypothetical protein
VPRKVLLVCGIASSLLYVAMNVIGAIQFEGYSSFSQTVSELSAIGAPSRPLWVRLVILYDLLVIAFGLGVWRAAGGKRALRVAGCLFVALGAIGPAWPPMHLRGEGFTLTDRLHIVFTIAQVLLTLAAVGFAATALGKRFRYYSIATIGLLLVFGALAGLSGPAVAANQPTPWLGVWERINIGTFLQWVVVLAIALLRVEKDELDGSGPRALGPAAPGPCPVSLPLLRLPQRRR